MSLVAFDSLPDSSRIWIFAADRPLSTNEADELLRTLDVYLDQWKAHGAPVRASRDLRYNQFLIIAADPEVTAPSGCSIDNMTRAIRKLGDEFKTDFFNTMNVYFRGPNGVSRTDRAEFKSLARTGAVDGSTTVYDNAITTLGELREGKWEQPARESWHARMLQ